MVRKIHQNIIINYFVTFFGELIFFVPIWVAYERQYLTFTQMSLISGMRFGLTALLELPTGALADLIGRKYSIILGFISEAIGLLIIVFSANAWGIFIGAFFRGAGDALRSGADDALIFDSLKESGKENEFPHFKANFSLITQISIIISSILGGYLYSIKNYFPYLVYAVCLILSATLSLLYKEPSIDSEKFSIKNYIHQTKEGIKQTMKNADIKLLSIFYILVGGITWSTQIFLNQIYASGIGFDEIGKSWLFAIIRFVNIFVIIKILRVDRLINRKYAFLIFPVLMVFSFLPSIVANKFSGTLFLATITMASTLRFIVLDKFTNEEFESKYRATAVSTLNLMVSIVYVLIISISGVIIDSLGVRLLYSLLGLITLFLILPLGLKLTYKNY